MRHEERAIEAGVRFLARRQRPTGEIPVYMARDRALELDRDFDGCVMGTIVTHFALRHVGAPQALEIRAAAARFLGAEMLAGGLWRYWSRERLERSSRSQRRIPPDTDDTSCALLSLGSRIGADAARSGQATLLANRDPNGRFLTWIPDYAGKNDVDSVVNANALAVLGDGPETREAAAYLEALVEQHTDPGSYYYDGGWAPLYYAISRARAAGARALERAVDVVIARIETGPGPMSPLAAALELCALAASGAAGSRAAGQRVERLLESAEAGVWAGEAYYCGTVPPEPRSVWFGSDEMTTALCVEALSTRVAAARSPQTAAPRRST